MTITKGLKQAYDMQDLAYDTAMALRATLTLTGKNCLPSDATQSDAMGKICLVAPNKDQAAIIAQLGKVWKDAQEQIRIHRGKPLPGSLTHEKVTVRRGKQARTLADVMMRYPGAPTSSASANAPSEMPDATLPDLNQETNQEAQAAATPASSSPS